MSTDEVAGSTDWFDLGVTLSVEGREVPFLDVFLALSRGEQHMLLPDGAYFSLQKPELQALAKLIEEARALQDSPPGQLRISRYQAGLWDELAGLGVVDHQAAAWQEQVRGCCHPTGLSRRTRQRRCGHGCGPTSRTDSAGWRSCGSTGSAASSPTTWASARPCRPWRSSAMPGEPTRRCARS